MKKTKKSMKVTQKMHGAPNENLPVRILMGISSKTGLVILAVLALSLIAGLALPKIRMQNDLMFMIPENNVEKEAYLDAEEAYGNSGGIVIAVTSGQGIYQKDLINRVRNLGIRIKELNIRIPAGQLENRLSLPPDQALALAGLLQSLSSDPDFSVGTMKEMLSDKGSLAETISDSLPGFMDTDDPESMSLELAETLTGMASSDPALAEILFAFSRKTTDRRGLVQNMWVDKVVSLTETDTVWPEFSDHAVIREAMAPFGFPQDRELDLLADFLLEKGATQEDDILKAKTELKSSPLFSSDFQDEIVTSLTPDAARALSMAMLQSPKQIRVGNIVPNNTDPSSMELIRERLHGWSFFERGLFSKDEKSLLVVVRSAPNLNYENRALLLSHVSSLAGDIFGDGKYTTRMAGYSVVDEAVSVGMIDDVSRLFPLVVLVVIVFLFLSFRSFAGVVYPLLTVLIAVTWSLGAMSIMGVPLSIVTTALPVLLVAVGSAYGIHLVHYYSHHHGGSGDKAAGVADTLSGTGRGIVMAGLTTIAGFASLGFNDIVTLRDFGIFTSLGVFFALVVSLTLLSSLLYKFGIPARKQNKDSEKKSIDDRFNRWVSGIGRLSVDHWRTILALALVAIFVSVFAFSNLRVEMNNITFFKHSSDIRRADTFINKDFAGTVDMRIIFSTPESNGALDPVLLEVMDRLGRAVCERHPEVGKNLSILDLIRKMNQAFYFNDPSAYRIPEMQDLAGEQTDRALRAHYASYLDKYQRSDTRPFIDNTKQNSVLMLQVNTSSSAVTSRIIDSVNELLEGLMGDPLRQKNITYRITGTGALYLEAEHLIVNGQLKSIASSFLVVLVLVALILSSVRYGLLSVIPLCGTLVINFGIMGFLNIPLDAATSIAACVAIGIGIDYGLHYLNRYRILINQGEPHKTAIIQTAQATGGAIIINAVSVAAGFSVLMLSEFGPLVNLGFLIALTMVTSAVGSMTVLPAVLTAFHKKTTSTK